ncbi:Uncharacterised protein [Fusobacterium necrophorum subsp. necrophorum]|nr:Uncharacterised protein [Fusobacterium necrophorum subsp. necrophorum]
MSIRKIERKLRKQEKLTDKEKEEFHNFSQIHSVIIKLFITELEKIEFSKQYLITSRNKRIETIISKLCRPEKPKLDRIHDIAGVRMIFDTMESLKEFLLFLKILNYLDLKKKRIKIKTSTIM